MVLDMCGGGEHFDCTGLMVNTDGDLDLTELTFIKNDKKKTFHVYTQ